ncbi:OLC1v1005202C1 [Oldenlandia corymbosa var. corymbosa]|uniref:OLC1v1005202C1 n=1 Tax=Oldenlandia corymbosa var. corymbosa TaxID=529605 RepID=A0AAV1DEN1_OLDCO|nr:OLC1v1005202C1 [Oldenlandia corymbosa var. corymbosa]
MDYYSRVQEFYVQDEFTITDLEEDEPVPCSSSRGFPTFLVMHSESEQNAQPTVFPDSSSEENAPPENRLDDLDFVPDLFIPNVLDFPPFDEVTSPVFVLHAAFDDSVIDRENKSSAYSDSSVEPLVSQFQSSVIASPSTKSSATIRKRSFSHFTEGSQGWTMSAPAWEDLTDSDSEDSVIQYRMTVRQVVSDPKTLPAQVIKKPRGSLKSNQRS